ncbi:MAG: TM2 domain-containing protein, partial [Chlorobiota bacterium]
MPNVFQLMPSLEADEMAFVQMLIKDMNENQAQQFAMSYMSRRKDPSNMLIFTLIGFLGISGIQRFVIGQIGLGILYLLTGGLCLIGTIVDLINHKKLAFEYNT